MSLLPIMKTWPNQLLRDVAFDPNAQQDVAKLALAISIKRQVDRGEIGLMVNPTGTVSMEHQIMLPPP